MKAEIERHETEIAVMRATEREMAMQEARKAAFQEAERLRAENAGYISELASKTIDLEKSKATCVKYSKALDLMNGKIAEYRRDLLELRRSIITYHRQNSAAMCPEMAALRKVLHTWKQEEKWTAQSEDYPAPNLPLDSPVIQHLLESWTSDVSRQAALREWMEYILDPAARNTKKKKKKKKKGMTAFNPGIELSKLPIEVSEGFLKLLIPLLRKNARVSVHVRTKRALYRDIRLRVDLGGAEGRGGGDYPAIVEYGDEL